MPGPRLTPYERGERAYKQGEAVDSCPMREGQRTSWFNGWYDAKHRDIMPALFGDGKSDVGPKVHSDRD